MRHLLLAFTFTISIMDLAHDPKKVTVVLEDDGETVTVVLDKVDLEKEETLDTLEAIFRRR